MTNQLGRKLLLVTVMSLLSLFLAACGQSAADSSGSSETKSTAAPNAATNSNTDVSKMQMPAKPSPAGKAMPTSSTPNQVVIENFSFVPATLTVKAGAKVTWINRDDVPHTATDTDKRFNSKTLDTDDQFSFTFQQPGTYSYYCALHPKMTAQIIVK